MIALNAPANPAAADPAAGAPADASARGGTRPGRVLDNVWIAASSPQLTIALAALLAFTFAVAALLPQLPSGLDAAAAGRWLSTTAARYGRFGAFLSSSGLFNILAGPWIVLLLALTAFQLLLRCANQARHLAARRSGMPPAPQGLPFELIHLPATVVALESKLDALTAAGPRGVRTSSNGEALRPRTDAYMERRRWAAAGPLLTYAGPLLIVLGLLWNTVAGWRATDVPLTPGRAVQPGAARGLALSLITPAGPDGNPPAVVALTQGAATRNAWLGYARPAVWGAVWVSQRSSGPALQVRAASGGTALPLQALQDAAAPGAGASAEASAELLHLRFGQNESEQAFTIPDRNLAFRVVSYESLVEAANRPAFLIEGYQGANATPELNELVEDEGVIEWQGVTLTLQREAHVVVDLTALPGLPLLALGGLVLLLGAGVTAWGGLTRTWVNVAAEQDGALVAVRVAAPAVGQAEVSRIARSLAVDVGEASAESNGAPFNGALSDATPMHRVLFRGNLLRTACSLISAAAMVGIGAWLARGAGALAPQARTGLFFVHVGLGGLSLGALIVAAVESLRFAWRGSRPGDVLDPAFPLEQQAMRGRAGDPGRVAALAAFPLLTAGVLLGSVWGLFAFAAPVRAAAAEMWLLVAWLLAAAYCHATSGWRPLRASAWLGVLLIVAAAGAGGAAALAVASLLTV